MKSILRNFIIIILIVFFSNQTKAQTTGKFIKASIGFGSSTSNYDEENPEIIDGFGFYTQGEYIIGIKTWFSVRPYAGLIFTNTEENLKENPENYKVETKAFFLGGKIRLCAPIPWVAPFIETGFGASIGSFETHIPNLHVKESGVQFHIPIGLGLAIGPKHNIEIGIHFYSQPSAEQSFGGFTAGYTFPLD